MSRLRLHNVPLTSNAARSTRPTPCQGDGNTFYYFQNQRWYCSSSIREDHRAANKLQHFAKIAEAAAKEEAKEKEKWEVRMSHSPWPQTLHQFQQLPTEIKIQIIRIAIKEAIGEKCTKQMQLFDRRYLISVEGWGWGCVKMDYLVRTVEIMKRADLIRADCLGGLLGACRLFRNETIAWIDVRRIKGESWGSERGVRDGKGQVPYRVDGRPLLARGIRRDAKRWMAALYQFSRVYDGGRERANDYTWSRPSDKKTEGVVIVD